jgi:hypothetical protein
VNGLSAGEYGVRLRKDGYVERRFRVTLRQSSRLVVTIDLEAARGRAFIEVRRGRGSPPEEKLPLHPEISADGEPVFTPELNLPVGYRTIRVRAFGWQEQFQTVYILENAIRLVEFELHPAAFRLSSPRSGRPRFNPGNSGFLGTTELRFEASAPGRGRVAIFDKNGEAVFTRNLEAFETWSQGLIWDGRSGDGRVLPDGVYRIVIDGESIPWDDSTPVAVRLELTVTIDSSIEIRPLSLASGIPGLLYAPTAEVLPPGAFQVDGILLLGKPPLMEKEWTALPFSAAFRLSPLEGLEFAAALNVTPSLEAGAASAAGGTVKWRALKPREGLPLGFAAGLSYGWVGEGTTTPFGMDTGIKLLLPLSFHPGFGLSLLLSPAIFWTGDQGYPSEPIPRALLSGGLLFHRGFVTAGLSLRSEFRFGDDARGEDGTWAGPLMIGGELKIFPPPSSFVFSLLGGGWVYHGAAGAYGGLGIGLIY